MDLINACKKGDDYKVQFLLKEDNIDVNIQDNCDKTALHFAIHNGHTKIVKLLLNYKINGECVINTNICDEFGYTALYWASYGNYAEIVKLLLNYKINGKHVTDPNIQDRARRVTPLNEASYNNNVEIVKLLLDYKINEKYVTDPNLKDIFKTTALYQASIRGYTEIEKLLKDYIYYKDKVNEFIPSYYHYILTILIQKNRFLKLDDNNELNKSCYRSNCRSNSRSNSRFYLPNEILELIKKYGIIMCGKCD